MPTTNLNQGSARLHDLVMNRAGSELVLQLARLHRPVYDDVEGPTCRGCDRNSPAPDDPIWPCRTYVLLSRSVLGVQDVEEQITSLAWPAWRRPAG